jgi:predicted kinase
MSSSTGVAQLIIWVKAPALVRWERLIRRVRRDGPASARHLRAWAGVEAEHYARERTWARADGIVHLP